MRRLDKPAIVRALEARLGGGAATMARLAKDAALAATHEENRPESDKDMRSTEASYLARGQMERALDLERALSVIKVTDFSVRAEGAGAQPGCVVIASEGEKERVFVLVGAGGGERLLVGNVEVSTVTPQTPLGRVLVGARAGDEVEVAAGGGVRALEIVDVY